MNSSLKKDKIGWGLTPMMFYAKDFPEKADICSGNNSINIKESRCIS